MKAVHPSVQDRSVVSFAVTDRTTHNNILFLLFIHTAHQLSHGAQKIEECTQGLQYPLHEQTLLKQILLKQNLLKR